MNEDITRQAKKKKLSFKHYIALLQKMGVEVRDSREGRTTFKPKATLETDFWKAQPAEPEKNEMGDDSEDDSEDDESESESESDSEGDGESESDSDRDVVDKKAVARAERARRATLRLARQGK